MASKKSDFRPDSVGYWTEVKLDIVKKYAAAYATILAKQPGIKRFIYIDGFAGSGKVWSEDAQAEIPGSAGNALSINPRFSEYHLIDLDKSKASQLKKIKKSASKISKFMRETAMKSCSKRSFPAVNSMTAQEAFVCLTRTVYTSIGQFSLRRVK